MRKGLLIILSGPSGVGKGTVRKEIQKRNLAKINFSVSMTTRQPRDKETNGVDYFFVSKEEFLERIKNNAFLEYAEFVGNYYGTPKDKVDELRNQGKNVFLEIEINGANQIFKNVVDDRMVSFFLMPPSVKALEDRIRGRRTESEEVIQERLQKGIKEMTMTENYDYVIRNDNVERAAQEIADIINKKAKQR